MTGVGSLTATGDITTTTNMKANGDIVAYSTGSSTLSLPIASTGAQGTIKVGTNLSITSAGVLSSKDTIFTGGTITSAIVRGEGTFLQSTAGTSFTLTNDYTDVKFNVTDSGDRHFQF